MSSPALYTITLKRLPPLKPNDYMFEKFADKGKTKAEVFAWVTRDIMSIAGGLEKIEVKAFDKAIYKSFMTGKTDELESNGKKFKAKPLPSLIPCLRKKTKTEKPKKE